MGAYSIGQDYSFGFNFIVLFFYVLFTVYAFKRLKGINSLECLDLNEKEKCGEWTEEQTNTWIRMYSHPILNNRPNIKYEMYDMAKKRHERKEDLESMDRIARFFRSCNMEVEFENLSEHI